MADHVRDQILAALKTTLTGLTTTGARVFADRTDPLAADEVPGLVILQGSESNTYLTMGYPRTVAASLSVQVNAYDARTGAQADARKRANTIAKEVQTAIGVDVDLGGLSQDVRIAGTEFDLDSESDLTNAVAEMRYEITYHFKETTPDVAA